jgi:hypothetical protein
MYIDFFVEEYSAEAALRILLPNMLPSDWAWNIHCFRGKPNLLRKLPSRLNSYAKWVPENHRFVILVDRDRDDCCQLKSILEQMAINVGLRTKTSCAGGSFQVLNRIVIEELEAWFFGDIEAICAAYPGVPRSLAEQERFRNPDDIQGGTAEALEQVLQAAGHHLGGLEKARAAREIAEHMEPKRNRSASFQAFYQGLLAFRG